MKACNLINELMNAKNKDVEVLIFDENRELRLIDHVVLYPRTVFIEARRGADGKEAGK